MGVGSRVRTFLLVVVVTAGSLLAVPSVAGAAPDTATAGRIGFSPTALTFAVAAGESSASQPVAVVNGRTQAVHIAGLVSSDPRFRLGPGCGAQSIPAGGRCTTTLTYVGDASTTSATTTVTGAGGLTLTGKVTVVPPLTAVPDVLFPETFVGANAPGVRAITVRNNSAASLTLASALDVPATALTFGFAGCLGHTLAPGGSCPVTVRFQPRVGLADSAAVTLPTADGTWSTVIRATGVSRARIAADERGLIWTDVRVGATARRLLHLHTTTSGPVTVTSVSVPAGYTVAADGCSGVVLRDAATCTIAVDLTVTAASPVQSLHVDSTGGGVDVSLDSRSRRPFLVTPVGLYFGAQRVGTTSPAQDVVVTNMTALPQRVVFAHPALPGYQLTDACTGTTLAPGASCRVGVAFAPPSATFYAQRDRPIRISGMPDNLSLLGYGVSAPQPSFLRVTPTDLDFGDLDLAAPLPSQPVTVTNQGTAPVTLSGHAMRDPEFPVVDPCSGVTLAPGASCTLTVRPQPVASGETRFAGLTLQWNSNSYTVSMRFHADEELALQGRTDLGPVDLGGTVAGTLRFVNVGTRPITLSDPPPLRSFYSSFPVEVTADGCTGVTLQPGDSCPVAVTATPASGQDTSLGVGAEWDGHLVGGTASLDARSWFTVDVTGLALGTTGRRTPQPARVTLTNVGSTTRSLPPCQFLGSGYDATGCGAVTLAPGASRVVAVSVRPDGHSHTLGSVSWLDEASDSYASVTLSGDDVWDLAVPTTTLQLGPQAVGSAAPTQDLWVLNASDHDVVVQASTYADGVPVALTNGCNGVTLHPGGACRIELSFTPTQPVRLRGSIDLFLGAGAGTVEEKVPTVVAWGY